MATNKKVTLEEFRAWLSGVEEMQPDDWTPDSTQWRRIRAKIDLIVDSPKKVNNNDGYEKYDETSAQPKRLVPSGPSLLNPQMLSPTNAPPPFVATGDMAVKGQGNFNGQRVKTPDIDTSGTQYSSSLE